MQLHFRQDREEISPPARFHSNFIQLRDLREFFSFSVLQAKLASDNCTSLDQNDLRSDFFPSRPSKRWLAGKQRTRNISRNRRGSSCTGRRLVLSNLLHTLINPKWPWCDRKLAKILIEYHDLERALSGVLDSLWTTGVICNVVE